MKVFLVASLLFAGLMLASGCGVPPKYWCDSIEIAKKCDAVSLCHSYYGASFASKPVNIALYYEALCPFCRQFITEQLYPTWSTLYKSGIMNVTLVAYGNAQEVEVSPNTYKYTCQHGPDECYLNAVENCVMSYAKFTIESYFPIINCIEKADDGVKAAPACVTDGKLNWSSIEKCVNGSESNALLHKAALLTGSLTPAHQYVPWIVVNGAHTDEMQQDAQDDLLKFVCKTYTGKKPAACQTFLKRNRFTVA